MKLSVMMITYNHEPFIAQAIESALAQQVDFPFEIVIGEDCSTDRTREIVVSYHQRYPDRIRLLLPPHNMGATANALSVLAACSGEYIAVLEGDDLWTDSSKLRKQVKFLDENPKSAGCFSDSLKIDDKGNIVEQSYLLSYFGTKAKPHYSTTDIINSMGTSPANTLVMRRSALDPLPDWFRLCPRHSGLDLLVTLKGNLSYLDECLGAYRLHSGSTWTAKPLLFRLHSDLIYLKHLVNDDILFGGHGNVLMQQIVDTINRMIPEIEATSGIVPHNPELSTIPKPNVLASQHLNNFSREIVALGKIEIGKNHLNQALSLMNLALELDPFNLEASKLATEATERMATPDRLTVNISRENLAGGTPQMAENLTTVEYWDKDRPEQFVPWDVNNTIFSHILDRYLPVNPTFSCTEIGAYPGSFLCYMAKKFQYAPTAIEFSTRTDHIRRLFNHNRLFNLSIINDDFLKVKDVQFDVVTSFGFVEHFTDYESVIAKHFELAKPGGYVVISVPRFDAFQGGMFETVYDEQAYQTMLSSHNLKITDLSELKRVIANHTDDVLFANHVVGDLLYYNWRDKNVKPDKKWLVYFINKIQPLVSNAMELDDFLSPYILTISRKPLTGAPRKTDPVLQWLKEASEALASNNTDRAIYKLRHCISTCPGRIEPYDILCEIYLALGMINEAVETVMQALKDTGFSFEKTRKLFDLVKSTGHVQLLDEIYLRISVWRPENPEASSYLKGRHLTTT